MNLGIESQATPRFSGVKSSMYRTVSVLGILASLVGCSGGNDTESPGGKANILLSQANNYSSTTILNVAGIETASGVDLDINWGAVSDNLQCHGIAPTTELNNVTLVRFAKNLTEAQVIEKLASGTLSATGGEIEMYYEFHTDGISTSAKLSGFNNFGTAIQVAQDYVADSGNVNVLILTKGTTPAVGAQTMVILRPSATSSNTTVNVPTGCGILTFTPDMHTPATVAIPAAGPWVVDWSQISLDNDGNSINFAKLNNLLVGHFADKTVTDLEKGVFDLETMATSLWEISLTSPQTSADLAMAVDRKTNTPFTGFAQGNGVWALGVRCNNCQSPAPSIFSIITPTP